MRSLTPAIAPSRTAPSTASTLLEMLTYARPMGSRTEAKFRARYLLNLPGAIVDRWGNIRIAVNATPGTGLWSCHTDTVHHAHGRQRVTIDPDGRAILDPVSRGSSSCLGGDDTVGVYLMREMILAGVPGTYVFHYGEERGCIGASAIAWHDPKWLGQFPWAIALDRAGYGDVVTHQCGQRCASDAFVTSLATALATAHPQLVYTPAHGVYTDTAEYTDLIPECTNLSVGYAGQHGRSESVDVAYVEVLRAGLCQIDTSKLVSVRDPNAPDPIDDGVPSWYLDGGGDDYDRLIYDTDTTIARDWPRTGITARDGISLDDDDPGLTLEQCRDLYDRYMAEQRADRRDGMWLWKDTAARFRGRKH